MRGWQFMGGENTSATGENAERIAFLANQIAHHSNLYFNHAKTEISDGEYDDLFDELKLLAPSHPQLSQVGSDIDPGSEKVTHLFPMQSLDKATTDDEILHFVNETSKGQTRFLSQPKLDGSALSLEYRMGRLVKAATRGSGQRGENVTRNARRIANIPESLSMPIDAHVRGEVIMPLSVFTEKYAETAPNPRNLAAGALRQKHAEQGKSDAADLRFYAYDVKFPSAEHRHPDSAQPPTTNFDSELLVWLEKAGIEPAEWDVVNAPTPAKAADELMQITRRWSAKREEYHLEIDGVVIKLDDLNIRQQLGNTAHHPRWALAWKFPPDIAATVLMSVDWQTGRTGNVTPVARLAPQVLSGVTIENATLHNIGEVERLDIHLGDKVRLVRRGDVIPKVEAVIGPATKSDLRGRFHADGTQFIADLPQRTPPIAPTNCPSCENELIIEGAFLRCENILCSARTIQSLTYWCRFLEMDGIGEKISQQLSQSGLLNSIGDLYRLTMEDLLSLDRMAEKSANNVLGEIAKTTEMKLSKFLGALGLPGIGPELATLVAEKVVSFSSLIELVERRDALPGTDEGGPELDEKGKPVKYNSAIATLVEIDGVGEKVAKQLFNGIGIRLEMVLDLANVLTIIDQPIISSEENKLLGVTFCITGSLSRSRKEIQQEIKQKGGKVVGSVSSNLGYLVAGEKSGSKLSKAQSLGVTILTEAELSALLTKDESAGAETTDNISSVDENIKAQKGRSQTSLFDH